MEMGTYAPESVLSNRNICLLTRYDVFLKLFHRETFSNTKRLYKSVLWRMLRTFRLPLEQTMGDSSSLRVCCSCGAEHCVCGCLCPAEVLVCIYIGMACMNTETLYGDFPKMEVANLVPKVCGNR